MTVKLAGEIATDPATGQVTTTIDNAPQLPFSPLRPELLGRVAGPAGHPPDLRDQDRDRVA